MEEVYYKITLAVIVGITGIIRGYYEFRYLSTEKLWAYHELRERFFVMMVGFFFMVPGIIYIFTPWLNFASFYLSDSLRITSCVILLLNTLFFGWIHVRLGKNWSPILEIFKNQKLITKGPYRFVRHPMYSAIFIHSFLLFPVTANWLVGLFGVLSFGIIYPLRVKAEEQMMLKEFGEEYRIYMKRTGRLFPKLF